MTAAERALAAVSALERALGLEPPREPDVMAKAGPVIDRLRDSLADLERRLTKIEGVSHE